MSANTLSTRKPIYYVHSIISLLIMLCFGFLPPLGGDITPYGMKIIGVFLGLLYGWIFIELLWPSLAAMVILAFSGYGSINAVFGEGFSDSTVLMLFFIFAVVGFMDRTGVIKYIGEWFVSRKICVGRPWMFTLLLFVSVAVISALISLAAALVIMYPLFYRICENVGFKKDDKYVVFVTVGFVAIGSAALAMLPFRVLGTMMSGFMMSGVGYTYNQALFFLLIFLATSILIFAYLFVGKYILRIDVSPLKINEDTYGDLRNKKMTKPQWYAIVTILVFAAIMIVPEFLPKTLTITAALKKFGAVGACVVCLLMITLITYQNKPLDSIRDCLRAGINWDLIIMMSASMPLASALESDEAGILSTLMGFVLPLIEKSGPIVFIIIVVIGLGIATQFIHNAILMVIFTPTLCAICVEIGVPVDLYIVLMSLTCQTAYLTPGASAAGAIMHGNIDWISSKNIYLGGTLSIIGSWLIYLSIILPLGLLIY